jgi:hypothetical protein
MNDLLNRLERLRLNDDPLKPLKPLESRWLEVATLVRKQ